MVIEPHMKQGRQHKLISTIFLATSVTKKLDHNNERLCDPSKLGRLRFTCAHELAHWVLHKKLYSGTGDVAAYNGNVSSDESHGIIERQADTLASALLMPLPQIKKCFYRLKIGRTDEQLIAEMANIFEVSKQAMQIRLKSRNLI